MRGIDLVPRRDSARTVGSIPSSPLLSNDKAGLCPALSALRAGDEGIEPPLKVLETFVLPLN